jgi:hypothetical protein
MRYFYDKRCSISTTTTTTVKGALMKSFSALYTNIPCSYREANNSNLAISTASRDTDIKKYTMNLEPAYTGIKIGDRVELYDWTGSAYVSK